MNTSRGFIAPLLLALVAVLLVVGGGYAYKQARQGGQSVIGSAPVAATAPSGQKIYSSTKYGFEFMYPATWTVSETIHGVVLDPSRGDANSINLTVEEGTMSISCPVNSFHTVECKNAQNTNGVLYAREITAGQSTEQTYREQTLAGYFFTSQGVAVMHTLLTDAAGTTRPSTMPAFDLVLQSIKLTTQATSETNPVNGGSAAPLTETGGATYAVVPVSSDTTKWKTYRDDLYHLSFRYPNGWNVSTPSAFSLIRRFQLESQEGEMITISAHRYFSQIMLSNRNGDILTYDKLQDAWTPEIGSQTIQSSQLKNHFITLPAAIYGATWDIYSYNAQNRQLTSENGTQVQPAYYTASGYPVYEFDRPNGDTTTFYFIVPLPNGNAAYVYYYGGSVLPGLENVVKTISVL